MKEKIIIAICILVLLSGCSGRENKMNSELFEIYKIDEQSTIYATLSNPRFIKEDGVEIDLREELNSELITIETIISFLDLYTTANDGGSQIYEARDQDFYLVKCNTLPENGGVKDIFLSDNLDKIISCCTK